MTRAEGGSGNDGNEAPIDRDAVRDRLDAVTDPELDRPVTDLGFVDDVRLDGATVAVALRLPTGMCSPVFAWMMAADVRDRIRTLPAVETVTVTLDDHVFAEEITTGINADRAFDDVFEDAETGPESVRRKLDWKACLAREHDLVETLREADVSSGELVDLVRGDVDVDGDEAVIRLPERTITIPRDVVSAYLEKASIFDVADAPADALLVDPAGDPIREDDFETVRRRLRTTAVNKTNQGVHCQRLLESRYDTGEEPAIARESS